MQLVNTLQVGDQLIITNDPIIHTVTDMRKTHAIVEHDAGSGGATTAFTIISGSTLITKVSALNQLEFGDQFTFPDSEERYIVSYQLTLRQQAYTTTEDDVYATSLTTGHIQQYPASSLVHVASQRYPDYQLAD